MYSLQSSLTAHFIRVSCLLTTVSRKECLLTGHICRRLLNRLLTSWSLWILARFALKIQSRCLWKFLVSTWTVTPQVSWTQTDYAVLLVCYYVLLIIIICEWWVLWHYNLCDFVAAYIDRSLFDPMHCTFGHMWATSSSERGKKKIWTCVCLACFSSTVLFHYHHYSRLKVSCMYV